MFKDILHQIESEANRNVIAEREQMEKDMEKEGKEHE